MKNFFFFRSSPSDNGNNSSILPSSAGDQSYLEDASRKADVSPQITKQSLHGPFNLGSENGNLEEHPRLKRSHSFSSAALNGRGLGNYSCYSDQSDSPSSSNSSAQAQKDNHSSYFHTLSPERGTRGKRSERRVSSSSAKVNLDCSKSTSSDGDSNKVLDLYIDGEQQQEQVRPQSRISQKRPGRNAGGKWPPWFQYTAPSSPNGSMNEKPSSSSFREGKGMQQYVPPRDLVENGFGHESSEKLAKLVVDKLSQSQSKDHEPGLPITLEDIYAGTMSNFSTLPSNSLDQKGFSADEQYKYDNACFMKNNFPSDGGNLSLFHKESEEDELDAELRCKLREAENRTLALSNELEQESLLGDMDFNVRALIHRIRKLTEEKVSLSIEVSAALRSHMEDRFFVKEEFHLLRSALDSTTRKFEKEKNDMESALEKELDRRSSEWSLLMDKYQAEEQRLRLRLRELAEQNVNLQREVSSFSQRVRDQETMVTDSENQLRDLNAALEETRKENQELSQHVYELEENFKVTKEERDCWRRNMEDKEVECMELYRSITRCMRTCSEQKKTIDGLQSTLENAMSRKQLPYEGGTEKLAHKLQVEQQRLVGVEQCLRKEVESLNVEADSLRKENINLLNRLKQHGEQGGGYLTFKLDEELSGRVHCLQTQGLSHLHASTDLCSKLIDFVKGRVGYSSFEAKDGMMDRQFFVECELRVQGFRRGLESLRRGVQNVSSVLHNKSTLAGSECQTQSREDDGHRLHNEQEEVSARSELRAESLLTSLLREKLYAKEQEIEQLQAELATAARANDMLRCEIQNTSDDLSCATHRSKDLELQMMRKDEKINQLMSSLEECKKELSVLSGILPKVTEERDQMWKEVKQCSENNMLLNSEVNVLKKKIESLDEDILVKDGQINILKDSLGKQPFDLLSGFE